MKSLRHPRVLIALSLGLAAALVAYHWPISPRASVACEHRGWHFAFSRDSTKLAVLDRGPGLNPVAQILVLEAATGRLLRRVDIGRDTYPNKVAFAPDDKTIGILDAGVITKWDPNTGRLIARHDRAEWSHDPDRYARREILFSATGGWLLHDVHAGRVYDVVTGAIVQDYHDRFPDRNLGVHGGCVAALVENEVKTFDVLTSAELGRFPMACPRGPMARTAFIFSAEGMHGVYFSDQWVVHNALDGRECRLNISSGAGWHDVHFADNRYVAMSISVVDSNTFGAWSQLLFNSAWNVRVFDTNTGAEVGQPIRNGFRCCFASDGHTLAVGDAGESLTLWDWPPPARWPLMLVVAITIGLLSFGVSLGWSWRRRPSGRGLTSTGEASETPALP
jgi:WD40 repeat protein